MTDKIKSLTSRALELFRKHYGAGPDLAVLAPGRINIIGEHTDYNDGHVLPVAIDRYTVAAARRRDDTTFRLYTGNLEDYFEFDSHSPPRKRPTWVSYILGVVMELLSAGQDISGIDLTIFTNVPIGAGVSSSAALEMSVATLLERLNALELDDAEMVRICRRADHKYVGIKSGPMDQFASRACRAGHAGLLDCRALEMTNFPLPEGIDFLSVYSGIPRMLAASEYNERMESCQSAVNILAESNRQIRALRDATMADVRASRDRMGDRTFRRARHVVSEQDRVFEFVEAAGKLDTAAMGRILAEGHESLSDDYEVSMPILDEMADWLTDQGGIIGARLTGAGFGGSLVCLSVRGEIDVKKLDRDFRQKFDKNTPDDPNIRKFASADGARHMESVKP